MKTMQIKVRTAEADLSRKCKQAAKWITKYGGCNLEVSRQAGSTLCLRRLASKVEYYTGASFTLTGGNRNKLIGELRDV